VSYKARKRVALSFLGVYFLFALFLHGTPYQDLYPFFSWSLFSTIPNPKEEYTIEISQFGANVYDPPLTFSETKFIFDEINQSPTEYTPRIRNLGRAIESYDIQKAERLEREMSALFSGKEFAYTLLKINLHPLQLWETGRYEIIEVVGAFSSENL